MKRLWTPLQLQNDTKVIMRNNSSHRNRKFCSKEGNKQFLAEGSPLVPWVWHEDNTVALRMFSPALSTRNVL